MSFGCLHEISPGGIPPLARAFRASTSHSDLSVKFKGGRGVVFGQTGEVSVSWEVSASVSKSEEKCANASNA